MSRRARPEVTLAIPLYRSERFVDSIVANVETVDHPSVEIVISDRHMHDDALEMLRDRLREDHRVEFVRNTDGRGWVDHYNDLLGRARGRYLRWMPHDDGFPTCDLIRLVAEMQAHPRAAIVYGPTIATDFDGVSMPECDQPQPHPIADGEPWTLRHSLDLIPKGYCNGAFKGLVDRELVLANGLFIRPTWRSIHAERAWLFAVSLVGELRFVPEYHYVKRYGPSSIHAGWAEGRLDSISLGRVMLGYLRDHGPTGSLAQGRRAIGAMTVQRLLSRP